MDAKDIYKIYQLQRSWYFFADLGPHHDLRPISRAAPLALLRIPGCRTKPVILSAGSSRLVSSLVQGAVAPAASKSIEHLQAAAWEMKDKQCHDVRRDFPAHLEAVG
jgi:hypothetical protein